MNLIQKVTRNGAAIADYRYLYDGTKTIAMDSRGEGLEYHGPFTYRIGKDGELTEDYITVKDRRFLDELSKAQSNKEVSKTSTDDTVDDIFNIFKFAAGNTSVEWVIHKNGNSYTLGTMHDTDKAGGWEDYGFEKPDASVHSHPGVQTSANKEIESMGYWPEGVAKGSDWDNVVNDVNANRKYTRLSYVYFPNSVNLYFVGYHKAPVYT